MIRVADFGDRLEAYDRLPTEPGARRLAVAQRAGKTDSWRGWQVTGPAAGGAAVCATKKAARQCVELLADRVLADDGPEFFATQFGLLAAAIGRRDGAAVLAVLEYLAAEGDRQIADELVAHMTAADLFETAGKETRS